MRQPLDVAFDGMVVVLQLVRVLEVEVERSFVAVQFETVLIFSPAGVALDFKAPSEPLANRARNRQASSIVTGMVVSGSSCSARSLTKFQSSR